MTDLSKVRARLDAVMRSAVPAKSVITLLTFYANAPRDMLALLDRVAELEDQVSDLRLRASRSESPTAYAVIRPANETIDLPKVLAEDAEGILSHAIPRAVPPPVPRLGAPIRDEVERTLSQLSSLIKALDNK